MAIHREIYILAGMDHPNIMRLFEVIDTKHAVNLVMELCLGYKLTEFTPSQGTAVELRNGITTSFLEENVAKGIFR
jgi:serine/threonine protein kinase